MTLDEARKHLEESEAAWAARPGDRRRQRQREEARGQLARVQRQPEAQGQQTLAMGDESRDSTCAVPRSRARGDEGQSAASCREGTPFRARSGPDARP